MLFQQFRCLTVLLNYLVCNTIGLSLFAIHTFRQLNVLDTNHTEDIVKCIFWSKGGNWQRNKHVFVVSDESMFLSWGQGKDCTVKTWSTLIFRKSNYISFSSRCVMYERRQVLTRNKYRATFYLFYSWSSSAKTALVSLLSSKTTARVSLKLNVLSHRLIWICEIRKVSPMLSVLMLYLAMFFMQILSLYSVFVWFAFVRYSFCTQVSFAKGILISFRPTD